MTLTSQAKTMGGVGSILMLLAAIPTVGWVLALAGAVLTLVAVKYISDAVGDASIYKNMIIAVILSVAGLVVGVLVILATVFTAMGLGMFAGGVGAPVFNPPSGGFMGMIAGAIAGLAVIWILFLVSATFVRRSYSAISSKLGVKMFDTAGLLYLVGAALTIVLVGFVLILVALVLNIIAFFSIPDQPSPVQQPQPVPPPP